ARHQHRADAIDLTQHLQLCTRGQLLDDACVQLRQLLVLVLLLHHGHHLHAPLLIGAQLPAPVLQRLIACQRQHRRHVRQRARIKPIGLGQLTGGFGKIARLARIDPHHRQAGSMQRIQRQLLSAPGCFHHHLVQRQRRQPVMQLTQARGRSDLWVLGRPRRLSAPNLADRKEKTGGISSSAADSGWLQCWLV
ncbi:hypothetical protein P2A44_22095, partial [Xanthomonas perforans]